MALAQEQFERWLAGLPADIQDPTLRNAHLVNPTTEGGRFNNPEFIGVPTGPTAPIGTDTGQLATSAALVAQGRGILSRFVSVLQTSGQVVAGTVAGTFLLGTQSQVLAVGAQSLVPPQTTFVQASDLFSFIGSSSKLRIRAQICTNSTAPTGDFTVGFISDYGHVGRCWRHNVCNRSSRCRQHCYDSCARRERKRIFIGRRVYAAPGRAIRYRFGDDAEHCGVFSRQHLRAAS